MAEHPMKRHVARIINTGQRCVVAMMQIPEREDHALVISMDNLPPRYEQALMDVLESSEGQNEEMLANVLYRRLMPDTGKPILETLHTANYMTAVPVKNIVMMPKPNMPFPLVDILTEMGKMPKEPTTSSYSKALMESDKATNKHNQFNENRLIDQNSNKEAVARNLIIEAELLENDAKAKRERAYSFAPHLRPSVIESHVEVEPVMTSSYMREENDISLPTPPVFPQSDDPWG